MAAGGMMPGRFAKIDRVRTGQHADRGPAETANQGARSRRTRHRTDHRAGTGAQQAAGQAAVTGRRTATG